MLMSVRSAVDVMCSQISDYKDLFAAENNSFRPLISAFNPKLALLRIIDYF